ncbi:MAG TPA: hypothetical protein VFQ07_01165, partial [Candidatus Polarisedimenticolia bacterium]|nr:hypothetical protein [Candidatus Polarisedimenticolia bacterium]
MRVAGAVACSILLTTAACGLASGLLAPPAFAMEVEQARTFEECDAVVRGRPTEFYCHQFLAQKTRTWREGIRHLEARLAADPDDHLALLALAILRAAIADPQSETDLRRAAEALAAEKRFELEGFARIGLFYLFGEQRRMGEAAAEMENAQKALDACGSPLLAAYLEYHRGLDSYYHVEYAGAVVHFKNAGTMADALKDRHLSSWVYNGLGLCHALLGKPGEAVEDYRHSADLAHAGGDGFTEAFSRYDAYDNAIDAGWSAADQERLYQEAL